MSRDARGNQPLAEMLRYNRWATLCLLDACAGLSDEQLEARPPGRAPVRELLVHLVGGMQTFALRTKGRQHEGELNRPSPWPGFDALRKAAERAGDELVAVAEGLVADRDIDLPYLGKVYRYPTRFFLVHAVEHGVEHRTEVKVALDQIGVATPDLDGSAYGEAVGYGAEVDG